MKFKESFVENEKLENRFLFDYLTINIRDMRPFEVLEMLCDIVKNEDVCPSAFLNFDTGALTSYNRSLRFMGERFITISWRTYTDKETGEIVELDTKQAVCVNITGTGCRFITEQDFYNLFSYLKCHDVNYTRLDIAFDDFNKVIPCDDIINAVDCWTSGGTTLSTMSKRGSSRIYKNTANISSKYVSSYNFELGSNNSDRKVRLYDKKVEQSRSDVDYWKRFELQLRRKKASSFIDEYLELGNIVSCYISYLSDFMRFLVDNAITGNDLDKVKTAPFWSDFLANLEQFRFLKIYI